VLDVLFLLSVSWRFLESFDDEGRSRRDNGHSSLTILDGELDGYTEPLLQNVSAYAKETNSEHAKCYVPSHQ